MNNLDVIQTMSEYYGKEMTPNQVRIYQSTLDDIPPELLDAALTRLIKTGHPFMPRVAELRKSARKVIGGGDDYDGPGFIEKYPLVDNYWRAIKAINKSSNEEFEIICKERWFQAVFPQRYGYFSDEH